MVGVNVFARDERGRILLVRRGDSGMWALPGGTVEWGETLRSTARRELFEEAGVQTVELGELLGTFSAPDRDPRFHAVTIVVGAKVTSQLSGPQSTIEIREARFFEQDELPSEFSHGNRDMLEAVLSGQAVWE